MEPARSTEGFSRRITATDSNNIVTVLDLNQFNSKYQIFQEDYVITFQVALEDLKVTAGLFGLSPAEFPNTNALTSEAQQQAEIARIRTESQKISLGLYTARGNGPWQYESEVVLMNQGGSEHHVPILVPFLSTNETLLVGGDFKLGVKIESKWNQPLRANDYLIIRGTYRQVVSFSKKKDDGLDALSDRISALESLLSVFGAPSATLPGSNGLTPAPPANGGNFLLRGDRTWQNPSAFVPTSNSGFYGSVEIPSTAKNGWAGLFFAGGGNKNYLMQNSVTGDIGLYNAVAPRWNIYCTDALATISLPLKINTGSTIKNILTAAVLIDVPNLDSQGLHTQEFTVTGATVGSYCSCVPTTQSPLQAHWTYYFHAVVEVANIVKLYVKNDWVGSLDIAPFWIRILIIEF
jgi:hypothetical protein